MLQLRNLRLVRGISLADLKSTCDAGGDVKLTKMTYSRYCCAWLGIFVSDMTVRHCAPVFLLNLFIFKVHPSNCCKSFSTKMISNSKFFKK